MRAHAYFSFARASSNLKWKEKSKKDVGSIDKAILTCVIFVKGITFSGVRLHSSFVGCLVFFIFLNNKGNYVALLHVTIYVYYVVLAACSISQVL